MNNLSTMPAEIVSEIVIFVAAGSGKTQEISADIFSLRLVCHTFSLHGLDAVIELSKSVKVIELPSRSGQKPRTGDIAAIKRRETGNGLFRTSLSWCFAYVLPRNLLSIVKFVQHGVQDSCMTNMAVAIRATRFKARLEMTWYNSRKQLKRSITSFTLLNRHMACKTCADTCSSFRGSNNVRIAVHKIWQPLRYISKFRQYHYTKSMSTFFEVVSAMYCRKLEIHRRWSVPNMSKHHCRARELNENKTRPSPC